MRPSLIFILLSLAALSPAWSQPRDSEAETIARCLRELDSPDPAVRRGAAMVIGKYDQPEAIAALRRCLQDGDAGIRHSALVSLAELTRFPMEAQSDLFRLLADPDVQVRRLASSLLRNALGIFIRGPVRLQGIVRARPLTDAGLAAQHLNRALADPDLVVRKNVLEAARFFPFPLQRDKLEAFLQDETPEIVVLALRVYLNEIPAGEEAERARVLQPLLRHPARPVRLELAETAGSLGIEALPLLQALSRDPDPGVSLQGVYHLALRGDPQVLPQLTTMLLDENRSGEERQKLLPLLRRLDTDALPIFRTLLQSSSPSLRAEALRMLAFARQTGETAPPVPLAELLGCLDDSAPDVRQLARVLVQRHRTGLQQADFLKLLASPRQEVREMSLALMPRENHPLCAAVIGEALLDENSAVRQQALALAAALRIPGWSELMLLSLEDENKNISELAARALLTQRTPEVRAALKKYQTSCTDPKLLQLLDRVLR